MKKLFKASDALQITAFKQIKYYGEYALEAISKEYYHCVIDQHRIQIDGKDVEVQHLQEDGFLVTCSALQKLVIERIVK